MLKLEIGNLVQSVDELPGLFIAQKRFDNIFIDFETTSSDPKLISLNPWHHCDIAGICICTEANPAYYIPIGHRSLQDLPREEVLEWLQQILNNSKRWINHNIKYDAHVAANAGLTFQHIELVDTLTLAKLINSDRFQYGLSALSLEWLEKDISSLEDRIKLWLNDAKSKDYGDLPPDLIAPYGCQDVLTVRDLYRYIQRRMPEECIGVCKTEIALTRVLFDAERRGFMVDPMELKKQNLVTLHRMLSIEAEIQNITGLEVRPHTTADCFDVLCNHYGIPVLSRTEKGNPSFDKDAIIEYMNHPLVVVEPEILSVIELIAEYRKLSTFISFFVEPYQKFEIDGVIHSWFNQSVRTGRMSSKEPNAQQLNHQAKLLIHPRPGYALLSIDFSQMEFRLIVHYINNLRAIAAYNENPLTDFHALVAGWCGIPRKPAKNINFAMGYGAGKPKILAMLSREKEIVAELPIELRKQRANQVYEKYHEMLPELQSTSWRASSALKQKGYIRNAYGRHRHLKLDAAFRSFNTVIQGCAADLMKERTVAVAKFIVDKDIHILAAVHDELLFESPIHLLTDAPLLQNIIDIMETPSIEFKVSIKVEASYSFTSWGELEPLKIGEMV